MSDLALPQQIENINAERAAIAPYNFVPLPAQIVPAKEVADDQQVRLRLRRNGKTEEVVYPHTLRQDRYYQEGQGRYTGHITCTLTTESPLYVRCALTLKQFEQSEQEKKSAERDDDGTTQTSRGFQHLAKNTPEFFYTDSTEMPVIPGSSLRGMLRALVEIASYSKMAKVTQTGGYFFRAVAAKADDPLARPYRDLLKNVRAGYLVRDGEGWAIRPARTLNGETFIKVRERDIPPTISLVKMHNLKDYHPQYLEVSFTTKVTGNGRTVVDQIGRPGVYSEQGWMVTSGNMIETGKEGARTPRKNHCVVLPPTQGAALSIDRQAIEDYCAGLTEFQRSTPFSKHDGVLGVRLKEVPVFYCEPAPRQKVIFFGHSPNFRIPYRPRGADHALAPIDFVPKDLRDPSRPDLAEAIFGFVHDEAQPLGSEQVRAGRVFVSDALFEGEPGSAWLDENGAAIVPHILSGPKPTTFQHYLVQTSSQKRDLRHYASKSGSETVLRGHKLYWHKGPLGREKLEDTDFLGQPEKERQKDTQHTQFRPVKAGMTFTFHLHFENLSQVELGALLWVLNLADNDRYRLKLGMGKSLGMGAVKLSHTIQFTDRTRRYAGLFAGQSWETGATDDVMTSEAERPFVDEFERYVLKHSGEQAQALRETLRIQCLLALLTWPGPLHEQTRYMNIERRKENGVIPAAQAVRSSDPTVNEYRDRPVLPTPLQVIGAPRSNPSTSSPPRSEEISSRTIPTNSQPQEAILSTTILTNPQPHIFIPSIGDIITGNRNGPIRNPIRGVKVDINDKWYQVSLGTTVIGVIRAEDAGGQVSGGFKGEVIERRDEQRIIYLILKRVTTTRE